MLVTLLFLLALSLFTSEGGGDEMSFSDFQTAVADGRVQSATIHDADQTVLKVIRVVEKNVPEAGASDNITPLFRKAG